MVTIRVKSNDVIQTLSLLPLSIKHLTSKDVENLVLIEHTIKAKSTFKSLFRRRIMRFLDFFTTFAFSLWFLLLVNVFNIINLLDKIPLASWLIIYSQSCNRLQWFMSHTTIQKHFLRYWVFNHKSTFTCLRLEWIAFELLYLNVIELVVVVGFHLFNVSFNSVEGFEYLKFTCCLMSIWGAYCCRVFFYHFTVFEKGSHSILNVIHHISIILISIVKC